MTERKWTPGPWVVSGGNGRILSHWEGIGYWEIANAAETSFKGDSGDEYFTDGDIEANAHLIAAAPDLYEALSKCLHAYESMAHSEFDGVWSSEDFEDEFLPFKAALAKARGEKQ